MAEKLAEKGGNSLRKNLLEIGAVVAAVAITAELDNTALKLKNEGKLNREEAEKMIHEAVSKYTGEGTKYVNDAVSKFDDFVKGNEFVTKNDIKSLKAQIDKLNKLSGKAAANLSKKASKGAKKVGKMVSGKRKK